MCCAGGLLSAEASINSKARTRPREVPLGLPFPGGLSCCKVQRGESKSVQLRVRGLNACGRPATKDSSNLESVTSPLWASVSLTWSKNMGFNNLKSASGTRHLLFISVYSLSKPLGQLERVQTPNAYLPFPLPNILSFFLDISSFLGVQREPFSINFTSQLKAADPTSCFHSGWSCDPGLDS